MSKLEDNIRRVMARHADEAPPAADLLRGLEQASRPRRRRPRWYVPVTAAAAVAAVAVTSVWAGGIFGGSQQAGGLACPASYAGQAPWVPAKPSGVDGRSRLVPQTTPSSALVCAYRGGTTVAQQAGWALSGQRPLVGGLAWLAAELTWQPRQLPGQQLLCTLVGGRQTNYLIGLSYPGGATLWVTASSPDACVTASNGEFTSLGQIGPDAGRALASGRWPAPQPVSCTRHQGTGRLGQDTAMVPAGSTSVTLCGTTARTLTSGYQALVTALNQLPTRPSTLRCNGSPSGPGYQLLFSYPEGPPVSVRITSGCYPEIDNGGLQSNSATSILPIIRQLLQPQ